MAASTGTSRPRRGFPSPPDLSPQRHRARSGGISAGTVIGLIIAYLVIHYLYYSGCLVHPSLLSWPGHCPYYLP
jgi:hypothetical protein